MVHKNQNTTSFTKEKENYFDRIFVKDYIAMCKKGIEEVTLSEKVHEIIT
jgi:hypothetical protein